MCCRQVNLGGEFDNNRSDVETFTRSSPQLAEMLGLGAYLAEGGPFFVKKIKFDKDFRRGYFGVLWTCGIGDDLTFKMHLTLAKWDVHDWLTTATIGYKKVVGEHWDELMKDLEQWMIETSPELLSIDQFQAGIIIGTRTQCGRWRVIMRKQKKALVTQLRLLRNKLEAVLSLAVFNKVGELHYSLDAWRGVMPPCVDLWWASAT